MQPSTFIKLRGDDVRKMLELMEELEDSEDTKTVFANFDISKEDMGRIADAG